MLQTTAIGAAATVLKSAVVAAVNPTGEVAIESVLKAGWERASHAIGCFRKNWNRLEPQENLILYRAMLLAHWRALQQTAQQHGRHRGMDLKSVTDVLPLPAALKNALDRNPSTGLGLFSQSDQEALRKLVAVCDDRIAAIEKEGPIGLPHEWTQILDTSYDDITALLRQGKPLQGPADQAWTALQLDFSEASLSPGFKEFFLGCATAKEARELWESMVASGWEHLRKDLADAKILEAKLCKTDPPRD